jgi:alpha-beta hydrolase superfamily lysophospholipase
MKSIISITSFFMLSLFSFSVANASDLEREKRMADEIVDAILDGEAVFLEADSHKFLTIYTEAEESKGVVIILHGRGFHPDWQDAINPLRVGLVDSGWSTLSVQMPVLEKHAKYYDYIPVFPESLPRIDAAIEFARKQINGDGSSKVILAAHSCGAHKAIAWIEKNDDVSQKIDAYIGIGMGATDYRQPMEKPFPLDSLTVPVLDVYADGDYPAVLKMAPERLAMITRAGNTKSRQLMLTDADHYYEDRGEELTELIEQWLKTL